MKFDTRVIDGYEYTDKITGAASFPKYQTSTFNTLDFEKCQPYTYSRFGNPTLEACARAIAALEGVTYGLVFASGMAAISATLFLLQKGDHLVLSNDIYGGTYQLVKEYLVRFGIEYTMVDAADMQAWENAIQDNTKALYIETPSNPLLSITDIRKVVALAHKHGLLTFCDNTFMSPCLQNPAALGVDVVIQSATKFLGGHSDLVLGWAGCNNPELYQLLYKNQKVLGAIPGVEEAWLCMRGLKTLAVRMEKACNNAEKIAAFLEKQPQVAKVYYPSSSTHPGADVHRAQARNGGALLSFELRDVAAVKTFFSKIKYPLVAVSLGGVESILSYPWTMSHACMSEADRLQAGVKPNLIRLSAGIENLDDLLADFQQALS